jgi:hypothetical protein
MKWRWTEHIIIQLQERGIRKELVETTLVNPDKVVMGQKNRVIYQKIMLGKLLRVVTEGDLLITTYITDKIEKYVKEGH